MAASLAVDQLGTPREVSDQAGNLVWVWAYQGNPFGEKQPTSTTGYVLNLRFRGQYHDAETKTNYNAFRTYELATGRYLQSDPIRIGGGISTYAYVGGNPLSNTDPLGLVSFPFERPVKIYGVTSYAKQQDEYGTPQYLYLSDHSYIYALTGEGVVYKS